MSELSNSAGAGTNPPPPVAASNNSAIEEGRYFLPLSGLPPPDELKDIPGAQTWLMEGVKNGVLGTSVMIAEVEPGKGPPLHLHYTEEIQFILEASHLEFLIGEKRFTVTEPGVVHIPANTPHAFVNRGDATMRVVTFFPTPAYSINWKNVGPSPLS